MDVTTPLAVEGDLSLEELVSVRDSFVSKATECESNLKAFYLNENADKQDIQELENIQSLLFQKLEDIDLKIFTYKPSNIQERKLKLTALLDMHTLLNDIDESNEHIRLLRENIQSL